MFMQVTTIDSNSKIGIRISDIKSYSESKYIKGDKFIPCAKLLFYDGSKLKVLETYKEIHERLFYRCNSLSKIQVNCNRNNYSYDGGFMN